MEKTKLQEIFISDEELSCYDRLHQDAYARACNKTVNKKLLDALMDNKYVSRYQNNGRTNNKFNLNSAQRSQSYIKNRESLLKHMIDNAENTDDVELTFHPKISESSKEIVLKKFSQNYTSAPVGLRLYELAKKKESESMINLKCKTGSSNDNNISRINIMNFLRRVEISEYFKQKKMSIIKANTESEMTFKPQITSFSQKILASDPSRFCETMEERINRLAIEDVKKREIAKALISKKFQYDFQPKISRLSTRLAKSRNEKAKNDQKRETPKHEPNKFLCKEQQFQSDRELKDKSSAKYSYLKSNYKDPKEIMLNINNNRQRRIEALELKKEQESQKELSQCTFRPEIKFKDLQHLKVNSNQVKGLGRFYELKSMAARQQEEEKERHARVFACSKS